MSLIAKFKLGMLTVQCITVTTGIDDEQQTFRYY